MCRQTRYVHYPAKVSGGGDDAEFGSPRRRDGRCAPHLRPAACCQLPLWSQPLFDLLNSRASQRYFLAKTFGSDEAIDQGLLEYDYLTAHQPGAQHAPYCFISAIPFSADINRVYDTLDLPVWLAHGVRGDFNDYSGTQKLAARPNWQLQVFQTGGLPYFEQPDAFFAAYDGFMDRAGALR